MSSLCFYLSNIIERGETYAPRFTEREQALKPNKHPHELLEVNKYIKYGI